MTPAEFRAIRHALGLSTAGMAIVLRVNSGRVVRKWEAGGAPVPEMAEIIVKLALQHPVVHQALGITQIAERHACRPLSPVTAPPAQPDI